MMTFVPPATSLRRVPVQRRSAERLTRILDACADLLDEVGHHACSVASLCVTAAAGVPAEVAALSEEFQALT